MYMSSSFQMMARASTSTSTEFEYLLNLVVHMPRFSIRVLGTSTETLLDGTSTLDTCGVDGLD